jgi:hypothetical protein
LYGKVYPTSDAAHKAMQERGYTDIYYPRSSVPLSESYYIASEQRKCYFDALYRYWKHYGCRYPVLRDKLAKMAKEIGIFHPVARVFTSPRPARQCVAAGRVWKYAAERSLI